jgi:tetratricopeptide (TPR) repeat protein
VPASVVVSPALSRRRWLVSLGVFVIVGFSLFAFFPALHGDWLWDDSAEITQNLDIQDPAGLAKLWIAPSTPDYFPLKATFQWVEWKLWKDSVVGYHATNLLFHLLSALMLWRVLAKLGVRAAWLGALLFAIHPLTVESVAWIAEFKNTVSLFLLLLAFSAYLDFDAQSRSRDYALSLIFFLAAMLCKTSVVMFPTVLLLHSFWKRGRVGLKDITTSAPFFIISLGLGLVTIAFQSHRAINGWDIPQSTALSRFACAGLAILFYLWKSIFPVGLLPIYPQWSVNPPSILQLSSWLLIFALVFLAWVKRETWGRHALFGLGWFFLNLLPVLGFVTMSFMHISWVADHFAYVPSLGIIGLVSALFGAANSTGSPIVKRSIQAFTAVVCVCLAIQAHRHARIFRDQNALWTYTTANNPGAWLAQSNLGAELIRTKKWDQAIAPLQESVRLKPTFAEARVNLGNALLETKRVDEAVEQLKEAVRLDPELSSAHYNLGNAYARSGRLLIAVDQYEYALKLTPRAPDIHYNLGNALFQMNQFPEAAHHFSEAARLNPRFAEAEINLGIVSSARGQMVDAIAAFSRAVAVAPESAEAQYGLADALAQSNRLRDSLPHYEAALRSNPQLADAHTSFADALLQLGETATAIQHYEEALHLNPNDAEARAHLQIAKQQGK